MDSQPEIEHSFENPITPHRKINWLLVIIIIVGFFSVLTAGYFLGTSSSRSKAVEVATEPAPTEYAMPTAVVEPTRETVRVITPNPTIKSRIDKPETNFNDIESWPIHYPNISADGLYSFQLPPNWKLTAGHPSLYYGPIDNPDVQLYINNNPMPESLDNYANDYLRGTDQLVNIKLISKEKKQIDRHSAIIEVVKYDQSPYFGRISINAFISNVKLNEPYSTNPYDGVLIIGQTIDDQAQYAETKRLFDQILSTFKFTN